MKKRRVVMGVSVNAKLALLALSLVSLVVGYLVVNGSGQTVIFFQAQYESQNIYKNITNATQKLKSNNHPKPPSTTYFHEVPRGTNIQVGDLEVHITTAVHYDHFPARNGFNVFLNGWAKHKTNMDFRCCLLRSLDANMSPVIDVKAFTYHVYSQWVVDMQNGEFSCSLSKDQLDSYDISASFNFITFAKDSCLGAPRSVLRIVYPTVVKDSVGVCLKISYGDINPELIVEWFEYVRLLGVTRVFTFLAKDLEKKARDVFMYYNSTGFLDAVPIHPAKSKNGTERGFARPRYEHQAWVDEVMAINDCKHTMSGLDYVIVLDVDEFIVPKTHHGTYLSILKDTSRSNPKAATFSFDSHVVVLNWKQTRPSPLHVMSKVVRTTFANYDGADRNTRWAFKPHRTFFAQNNRAWERKPFTSVPVPRTSYLLLHRRFCKPGWKNCETTNQRVNDPLILQHENRLIDALKQMPLNKLLANSTDYVNRLLAWDGKYIS